MNQCTTLKGTYSRRLAGGFAAALAALTLASVAFADSKPVGFGCPSEYKLVTVSNVLTCRKTLTSGTVVKTAKLPCGDRGETLVVKAGADVCDRLGTSLTMTCSDDYFLKVDYSGKNDQCVHYGYDYQRPVTQ